MWDQKEKERKETVSVCVCARTCVRVPTICDQGPNDTSSVLVNPNAQQLPTCISLLWLTFAQAAPSNQTLLYPSISPCSLKALNGPLLQEPLCLTPSVLMWNQHT